MKQSLVQEIEEFLSKHGKKAHDEDEGEYWNSPDAQSLEFFKIRLEAGDDPKQISYPNSSWESGGYKPYSDKEAKAWHDNILFKIKKLRG